jgi:hypothetical protein
MIGSLKSKNEQTCPILIHPHGSMAEGSVQCVTRVPVAATAPTLEQSLIHLGLLSRNASPGASLVLR